MSGVTGEFVVPHEQEGRQAIASLGGYVYQIIRSISEWMRLGPQEELFLEVAEDYAVVAGHALTMTQVKDDARSGSLTLRTEGAIKAITSLWEHQQANPDLAIRIVYLTTAVAGRERGVSFPDELPGVDYWRRAAAGADVEPLRDLLLSLDLKKEILSFIREASQQELREKLLAAVHWTTGATSNPEFLEQLKARLVARASERGLQASDGARALPVLVLRALEAATGRNRRLTQVDFETCWEAATTVPVSRAFLRQLGRSADDGTHAIETPPPRTSKNMPLPPRLARRSALVDKLAGDLRKCGALWLHGSSGLGKSILARLVVAKSDRFWRFVQLRGRDEAQTQIELGDAIAALNRRDFGGLVIDDLPVPSSERLRDWISAAVREIAEAGAALIVTSDRAPLPLTRLALEPLVPAVHDAPYLLCEDVAEMVSATGGNSEQWSASIHLTCGSGHPLLVDARIAGLASRSWPPAEHLSGLVDIGSSEVAGVRSEVALRLLDELSVDAHTFLLRLSVLSGEFDRAMAFSVAETSPPLARPGILFDLLVGPWIEVDGADRFSISPLVAQTGVSGLGERETRAVRLAVVDHLLKRRPFPADFLSTLLVQSLIARHLEGLFFIAITFIAAADRPAVARACPLLPFVEERSGVRLVPEHAGISSLLRLAQLIGTLGKPDHLMFEPVLRATLAEIAALPEPDQASTRYLALVTILSDEALAAPPRIWFPLLMDYHLLFDSGTVPDGFGQAMNSTNLGGLSPTEFFFAVRTSRITAVEELVDLFERLDVLEPEFRRQLLASPARFMQEPPLFVQAAWVLPCLTGTLDATAAVASYAHLTEMAEGWGESAIAVECIRSRAAILAEHLDDREGALAVLREGERLHPGHERLARMLADLIGNAGRHEEETGSDSIDDPLERATMLRAAAISAAKADQFDQAIHLFTQARTASESVWVSGTRTGLLGDIAMMEYLRGSPKDAVDTLRAALIEAEPLDCSHDTSWFTVQALNQLAHWLLARSEGRDYQPDLSQLPGFCSKPSPTVVQSHREIAPPSIFAWYAGAAAEARFGVGASIGNELARLEQQHGILPIEATNARLAQLDRAIRDEDADRFFCLLPTFVTVCALVTAEKARSSAPMCSLRRIDITAPARWSEEESSLARGTVSAFVGAALLGGNDYLALTVAERGAGLHRSLDALFPAGAASLTARSDMTATGLGVAQWLRETPEPDAEELLVASCQLFSWLQGIIPSVLGGRASTLLANRWLDLASRRPALLTHPDVSASAIERIVKGPPGGLGKIAELIETGAAAFSYPLSSDVRQRLAETMAGDNAIGDYSSTPEKLRLPPVTFWHGNRPWRKKYLYLPVVLVIVWLACVMLTVLLFGG